MKSALEQLETNLERFEAFCGYLALVLQLSFLGWVFYTLLHPFVDFSGKLKNENNNPEYAVTVVVWIPVIYSACLVYLCLAWICLALPAHRETRPSLFCAALAGLLCVTAYPVALVALFTFIEKEHVIELLTSWAVSILIYIAALGLLWVFGELLAMDPMLRYKVLLVERENDSANENKHWSIAAWSVFGGTVALAICYYAFRYDPAGTYKPGWTNSLG